MDLTDDDSNLVPSGTTKFKFGMVAHHYLRRFVFLQTQKEVPDQLELWMNTTTKEESIVAFQPVVVSLSLHNPTGEVMILTDALVNF